MRLASREQIREFLKSRSESEVLRKKMLSVLSFLAELALKQRSCGGTVQRVMQHPSSRAGRTRACASSTMCYHRVYQSDAKVEPTLSK